MTIGERIRLLRKQADMTIDALAKKVGVTRQTISRYETGAIRDIPRSRLDMIATELGVNCEYLGGWTMESQRDSLQFDIQQLKMALAKSRTEAERAEIEANLEILEESYSDLIIANELLAASSAKASSTVEDKKFTIGSKVREWHSDKKNNLSMHIDSWLLLALKGMAADSKRNLEDEIEAALYDHVMNAIDEESPTEDVTLLD